MQIPIINLNGDKASVLAEQYAEARQAIDGALEKLSKTLPHGRNFQSNATGVEFSKARMEHSMRMNALRKVLAEIEQLEFFCAANV